MSEPIPLRGVHLQAMPSPWHGEMPPAALCSAQKATGVRTRSRRHQSPAAMRPQIIHEAFANVRVSRQPNAPSDRIITIYDREWPVRAQDALGISDLNSDDALARHREATMKDDLTLDHERLKIQERSNTTSSLVNSGRISFLLFILA